MFRRGTCVLRNARGECFRSREPSRYNASVLGDYVDELDEAVYAEAERLFKLGLQRHGLDTAGGRGRAPRRGHRRSR